MLIKKTHNRSWMIVGLVSLLLTAPGVTSLQAGQEASGYNPEQPTAERPQPSSDLEDQWGVRVVSLRRTAAGHMLDFRFRIIDPEKAAALLRRQDNAYLIDQASGKKLAVPRMPKVGALRPSAVKPEAGRIYFILFNNTGDLVQSGNKVTIVSGDFKADHLVVE
jgi:hypothetical protein